MVSINVLRFNISGTLSHIVYFLWLFLVTYAKVKYITTFSMKNRKIACMGKT